ncbi:MAG: TolC family protein [Oligoflexia bacterium]|nr:TolC family protein [Oligoflexia bacterium]MBF0366015.1 TolC family protein [Oligoflexia bacterium]
MKTIFILILYCFIASGGRVEARVLTLQEATTLALKASEAVALADQQQQLIEEKYQEIYGGVLPQIDTTISYTHYPIIPNNEMNLPAPMPKVKIPLKKDYEASINTTVTQVLWAFGKVSTAIELAKKAKEASVIGKAIANQEIIYQTKLAYYTALFAKEVLDITESSYKNALINRDITKQRYALGKIPQGQAIKIEADVAGRVASKEEALGGHQKSLHFIKRLTALTADEAILLVAPSIEEMSSEVRHHIPNTPSKRHLSLVDPRLLALDKKIEMSDDMIKINRAAHFPLLAGFASFNYFGDSYEATIGSDNMKSMAAIGIKLTIPIFHGGSTEAVYRSAVIEKRSAVLEKEKVKKDLEVQLKNAITDYETAQRTLHAGLEAVLLAEKNYLFARKRYAAANVALSEVNDLELALTGQRVALAKSKFSLLQAQALIERVSVEDGMQ